VQQVSWWQAWELWWSGTPLQGYVLWGLPILWWGRIGKLAQFAGGLVAIIDIVGLQRLTAWAEWLRSRPLAPRRESFLSAGRIGPIYGEVFGSLMDDFQRWANSRPGSPGYRQRVSHRDLSEEAERVRTFVKVAFLLLAVSAWGVAIWYETVKTEHTRTWPWWWGVLASIGVFVGLVIAPVVVSAILTVVSVLANVSARAWPLLTYYLLALPAMALLKGPQPDRSLRVLGIMAVVAGFTFDLLACPVSSDLARGCHRGTRLADRLGETNGCGCLIGSGSWLGCCPVSSLLVWCGDAWSWVALVPPDPSRSCWWLRCVTGAVVEQGLPAVDRRRPGLE
jgi:hypothetical protein